MTEYDLIYALNNNDKFKQLPPNQKQVFLMLAQKFQDHPGSHFLSPQELAETLGSSERAWRTFLTLKPVRDYIIRRTQEDVEINFRQALAKQAMKAALSGDNQAAKFIKELYELNQEANNNTHIILHYIPRPDTTQNENENQNAATNQP